MRLDAVRRAVRRPASQSTISRSENAPSRAKSAASQLRPHLLGGPAWRYGRLPFVVRVRPGRESCPTDDVVGGASR